ncbi:hypothetical protein TSH58p_10070 [Azospirillum sp. TSH58]|uniref:hypothetical protein n=1 Tax=Azospirillum sp. TSH58 TaxID=664962 RepID=UPI000D603077|nr:hypothetical protein [Azospirillum sp. TSH58]AWJ83840.1 hypothetical protein TSH58p_10070 [Azospirillum sp. TSH58]MCR6630342.1 hypothetical protein [Magnetospirillum sp.]
MSISSVTSSAASGIAQQRAAGPGKDIRDGMHQLKDAVKSGDLDSIQSAYDSLSKLQSRSGSASDANSPLNKMLTAVGEALETGDVSQVQQAFAANGPKGAQGPGGPGGAGGPPPGPPPGGAGGPPDEMKDAMGSLSQALQSGDLSGAQESVSSLLSFLQENADDSATSSTSSSSSVADLFKTALQSMSGALQSGDLSGAQKAFSSLAPRGSQGVDTLV